MTTSVEQAGVAQPADKAANTRSASMWWIAGIFLGSVLGIWLLHPRISIPDVDAHASIVAAHSLKRGHGYRDLLGTPMNHWPPGYSFLLSLTPNPITGAQVINYLSFGGAVVMLFLLALHTGWPPRLALAFACVFGFGLLRLLACMSKPDILTFFIFLLAAWLYVRNGKPGRLLACFLWSALIPLKLIAVVFAPGVLLADWWFNREYWSRWRQHIVAAVFWLLFLGSVLAFNYVTIGTWSSPSYVDPSLSGLWKEVVRFVSSIFVGILAAWYGPLVEPEVYLPFMLVVWVGMAALSMGKMSLPGKPLFAIGISILVISWALETVRLYYADARLMGYGILLILLSFVPQGRSPWLWNLYAAATVVLAIYNVTTTGSLGTNHRDYAQVAQRVAAAGLPKGPLVSNSFHILDVHAGIPTRPAVTLEGLPRGTIYVEFTVSNYDTVAKTVGPRAPLDSSWREIATVEGARVFQKVDGESSGQLPPGELRVIY